MGSSIIRHVTPDDVYGIVDLLEGAFGGWPNFSIECSPVDHWLWKYVANPYDMGSSLVYEVDGEIVGCSHDVPNKLRIGGEELLSDLGSDLAVHPDYRGQGISTKIREFNWDAKKRFGYEFAYFVTSNPRLIENYERTREPFPYTVYNYVMIFDVDLQLEKIPVKDPQVKKYGYMSLDVLNRLRHTFAKKVEPEAGDVVPITVFDESYQRFWMKVRDNYDFIVDRESIYMNWRFCDPRGGSFKVFKAGGEHGFRGYIVLFVNKMIEGYPIGYIVDLLTEDDSTAQSLVSFSVDYFQRKGVNIINCLAINGSSCGRALQLNGFVNSMIGLKVFFGRNELRSTDEVLLGVLRKANKDKVYFSYGDIDSLPSALPRY